jgi:hypothetical protein
MTIKKQFVELVELLESNKDKKVSSLLDQVIAMAESKKKDSVVIKNADGTIKAIYCYYHKQWELLEEVEYGSKKSSASGFNTMCKLGVSAWTAKQVKAKADKEEILIGVQNGEIDPSEIKFKLDEVEAIRKTFGQDDEDKPIGYANEEEF